MPFSRAPPLELADLVQVQQRVGPRAVEIELDHQVGAALDRPRPGHVGAQPQRLVEGARGQDVHAGEA